MRALAFLLLLSLFHSPTFAPIQQQARMKLSGFNTPFTPNAFIQSVIAGDTEKVECFLKAGMSPDICYKGENQDVGNRYICDGDPALRIAIIFDRIDITSLLLSYGVNVNQPNSDLVSPLMIAKGDLVKTLLDRGAEVNWRNNFGGTALMAAVRAGDQDKVRLLLEQGADINAKNDQEVTAIQCAAASGQREVFQFLRMSGADIRDFSERSIKMLMTDPDPDDAISLLLHRLENVTVGNTSTGPSAENQHQVPLQLLEIADRSAESKAQVIDRMMDVVEDISAKEDPLIACKWMTAVEILGALKATEAVDLLINNLDHTGQNGIVISIHIHPVYSALVRIGEPAVPKLIEALSHPKPCIQQQAAWVLFSIQKGQAKEAIETAIDKEDNEAVKQEFKVVLDRIEMEY